MTSSSNIISPPECYYCLQKIIIIACHLILLGNSKHLKYLTQTVVSSGSPPVCWYFLVHAFGSCKRNARGRRLRALFNTDGYPYNRSPTQVSDTFFDYSIFIIHHSSSHYPILNKNHGPTRCKGTAQGNAKSLPCPSG